MQSYITLYTISVNHKFFVLLMLIFMVYPSGLLFITSSIIFLTKFLLVWKSLSLSQHPSLHPVPAALLYFFPLQPLYNLRTQVHASHIFSDIISLLLHSPTVWLVSCGSNWRAFNIVLI